MEKKVMELCETAKRRAEAAITMDGEVEEAQCIDALDQLKKSSFTCQLLVSTQVVRHLLPLTKHPRKKIQDFASALVVSWRNMFLEQIKYDDQNGSYTISGRTELANIEIIGAKKVDKRTAEKFGKISDVEVVKVQKVDQNGTPRSKKGVRLESGEMEITNLAENVEVEKVITENRQGSGSVPQKSSCMLKCNDCFREIVREKLYNALSKVSGEADKEIRDEVNACNPIEIAVSVESAMFEKWGRSNDTYKMKYRCVLFNIKDPENPDFRRKVLLGQVKPEMVVNMTAEEMASDVMQRWYQELEEERVQLERSRRLSGKVVFQKFTTDLFTCGRCGYKKTTCKLWIIPHLTEDIMCLNCYQYWSSTTLSSGLLPI